ncbi:EF-hand calcium-binding domain-containing protein 5-like isoform X2 [Convolutriloba macropyga]|uniref:EF-hand calcium-binding domain-containing protein 5-like isoform X2 n=1 Tax=Convolutriloba macropyga TaxID=536237 RepID=UPI003F52525C
MTASEAINHHGRPESGGNGSSSLPERPRSRTMPSYYHSNEPVAVKKLRRYQEQSVTSELANARDKKKEHVVDLQNEAKKAMRKVPLDILTTDWFVTTIDTVELRSYMVDKVLPQLVLGLEKLLMEADRRGLPYVAEKKAANLEVDVDKKLELDKVEAIIGSLRGEKVRKEDYPSYDPNFNPINYLARYLMRNNPRFNNQSESSPYAKGLRAISHQLRQKVFSSEENRLAAIKMEAKKKREEREERERDRLTEIARKKNQLAESFFNWVYAPSAMPPKEERDPTELVQLAYIQNVMRSFEELVQKLPPEMQQNAKFDAQIEATDTTGSTLDKWQFEAWVMKYVHLFSHDMFDVFMSHLEVCAAAYHEALRVARRQKIYTDLFNFIDTNIGYINRNIVIQLLQMFWKKCDRERRALLRDPRKWPVLEIKESEEDAEDPQDEEAEVRQDEVIADGDADGTGTEGETTVEEAGVASVNVDEQEQLQQRTEDSVNTQTGEPGEDTEASVNQQSTEEPHVDPTTNAAPVTETAEDGGEAVNIDGQAIFEEEQEGDEADETASVKDQRNIVEEIRQAEQEREKTGAVRDDNHLIYYYHKLREVVPKEQTEAFDENMLNRDQFALLVENFLGERCEDKLLYSFISYIRSYYLEADQDKLYRLTKLNSDAKEKFSKFIVEALFTTWDSDGKGYVEVPQFISVAEKYKGGVEQEALELGLDDIGAVADNQLTQDLFVELVIAITGHLAGGEEEQLQPYVQFLNDSIDKSHEEKIRGLARRKWLDEITAVAQSTGDMEAVYRAVFNSLYKDAESHGRNKKICASICMLESNPDADADMPDIPTKLLRCVAATVEDASFMLGHYITHLTPNVSFPAMSQREMIHVPKVKSHGSVHYWHPRRNDRDGSLIVCPVLDGRRSAYGTLAVDTLRTQNRENRIFLQHELAFVQGVAQKFHEAFALIDIKRRSLKIVESCIKWIKSNCPSVREVTFFLVESDPSQKEAPFTLRMMCGSDYTGNVTYFKETQALALQDNMFKEYLYKAVSNSETVIGEMLSQLHMACPIRDPEGFSRAVMDINLGTNNSPTGGFQLNKLEKIDLARMLKIQQDAFHYMSEEAQGKTTTVLDIEKDMGAMSVEILFERMMLLEMRQLVKEIGGDTFAEMKSYSQPPLTAVQIVDILIEMFLAKTKDQFNNWNSKKLVLSTEMLKKVAAFDPTAPTTLDVAKLRLLLNEISKDRLSTMGPFPAQTLYNWLIVAISLMEHADHFRVTTAAAKTEKKAKREKQGESNTTVGAGDTTSANKTTLLNSTTEGNADSTQVADQTTVDEPSQ